ncbi:MAG: hypothetical protein IT190_10520, partial [Microbacteriaceae bacterium]|nr:hypothetical protein [Microbacteriaceae bacterium]
MHHAFAALLLLTAPAFAGTEELTFDTAKQCAWQKANNSMDEAECVKLEDEAKAAMAELEAKAD